MITVLHAADGRMPCKKRLGDRWAPPETPFLFTVERQALNSVRDLGDLLLTLSADPAAAVIRGEPVRAFAGPVRRLRYDRPDAAATFRSMPGGPGWVCMDLDKVTTPPHLDPALRPVEAVAWLRARLPSEFTDVACVVQWSASAGLDGWRTLSAHLWFFVDGDADDDALRDWASEVDLAADARLFDPVQLHFTAAPLFLDGADPLGRRVFLLDGARQSVAIKWPSCPLDRVAGQSRQLGDFEADFSDTLSAAPPLIVGPPNAPRRPMTLLSRSPRRR